MILPIEWLKELVEVEESSEELAEIFLKLGFPADEINAKYLDLEITPNRGDCLSVLGLSREYAAYRGIKLKKEFVELKPTSRKSTLVKISPPAQQTIWRYSYFIAEGEPIGESDRTIKERLKLIGLNSKNTIVDLTNYLMHETGQPLHAFDLDKVKEIRIDYARYGNTIKLLNNQTIKLTKQNLVIYDGDDLIDLFGICGGEQLAVEDRTKRILIQAAAIEPSAIRRSSKSSGVVTPASYRYERYVDYNIPLRALGEVTRRLRDVGWHVSEVVDVTIKLPAKQTQTLTSGDYHRITGLDSDDNKITGKLTGLGFAHAGESKYQVPSWRQFDVQNKEALAEEVLRIEGFDRIHEEPLPPAKKQDESRAYHLDTRAALAQEGYTENYSYSFISAREAKAAGYNKDELVEIANPLSSHYQYLRPSLKIGLAKAALANPWINDFTMYEFGNVFSQKHEVEKLGMISTRADDIKFGAVDKITPKSDLGRFFRVKRALYFCEIDADNYKGSADAIAYVSDTAYHTISKFPPVVSDIAFVVAETCNEEEIIAVVKNGNRHILIAEIFDVYRSGKIGAGLKSIALRLVYQDTEKTLTAEVAAKYHRQTVQLLKNQYHAQIRGE